MGTSSPGRGTVPLVRDSLSSWRVTSTPLSHEGDPVADDGYVREIFEASYRRLVVQLYGVTGDLVDAEDAVQEAFARAVAGGARWRDVDNPEAWLRTVALNVIRRRWRRAKIFTRLAPRISTPADIPGISEDHVALMNAMRALPTAQREAVALFYLADLSVAEVASALDVAEGTVKSRLKRGRDGLQALLTTDVEGAKHA